MLHVALYEPEIPPNTGNIARLCAATGTRLHLIGRLGFRLHDRALKRAGLDYWPAVDWVHHRDFDEFEACWRRHAPMIPLGNAGSAADTASQSMETATTGTIGHGAKPGQDVQDPTVLPVDALVTPTITVPEATAPAGRQPRLWLVETPALRPYTQAEFAAGDCLLFGNESRGLPPSLRQRFADSLIGIPMPAGKVRSLNLATAVAIVLYDALRRIHRW